MKFCDSLNNYSINWSVSVNDITSSDWEDVFGKSVIKSQEFFLSIEKSSFPQIKPCYLQIFHHEIIVAIVPCFCYEIDILNLVTSSMAKTIIKGVRQVNNGFLKIKAFVTGTYAASCEHFIEYKSTLSIEEKRIVCDLIDQQLKEKCKRTESKFIFVKEWRNNKVAIIVQNQVLLHSSIFLNNHQT